MIGVQKEKKYYKEKDELSVEEGCLFLGIRIVVPDCLKSQLLNDFHKSHLGIVKIKALARSYVWWQGIDSDIENLVKSCKICIETKKHRHGLFQPLRHGQKSPGKGCTIPRFH